MANQKLTPLQEVEAQRRAAAEAKANKVPRAVTAEQKATLRKSVEEGEAARVVEATAFQAEVQRLKDKRQPKTRKGISSQKGKPIVVITVPAAEAKAAAVALEKAAQLKREARHNSPNKVSGGVLTTFSFG